MLQEYQTNDVFEMTYLYYKGFPHEFDRSNPQKVKMIFKGDPALIRSLVRDLWEGNTRVDALKLLNASKGVKKSLWVDGVYKPNFYKKSPEEDIKREIKNNETHTDQKEI